MTFLKNGITLGAPKFLAHWQPILIGIASLVVATLQTHNHGGALIETAKDPEFQTAVLLGLLGMFATKQRGVTGGTVGVPTPPDALTAANQAPASGIVLINGVEAKVAPVPVPPPQSKL